MKTNPLLAAVVIATVPLGPSVLAQTTSPANSSPVAPPPPPPAEAQNVAAPLPSPDRVVYTPRLPTAQELTNAAAAGGFGIERMEQMATQVTVVYKLANGQTSTVAYAVLPPATVSGSTVVVPTPAPTVVTTPAPTVIYTRAPRVVYYDPFYYDPWYTYPPVSVSLGFGFGRSWGGGHYHGHYGGGHFRHR